VSTATYGNLAIARPMRRPGATPEHPPRRHLEIAPSRAQRRARPRLAHAVVTIAGIGVILLVQLLLSILLADGAYTISALQTDQRELLREEQALNEQLELLGSTQNLTANAEALGMVASGNPLFLDVATGGVSGKGSRAVKLPDNLVGNSLLDGSTVIDPAALAAAQEAEEASGDTGLHVVEGGTTVAVPPTSGTLPSPTTH
jgi:ABC-type phosphate transport system substrate-binding protein